MMLPVRFGWVGQASFIGNDFRVILRSYVRSCKMKTVAEDRWLSVEEIADYLGIKRDTVYKWIDRKKMPAHKMGSLWKFKRDEVDDWVRSGGASESCEFGKPR
jgi:excisionase family DNA binding protein